MPYYYDDLDYYSRYGVYRYYDIYDPVYGAWDPAYPYSRYPQYYPSHWSTYYPSYYSRYYDDLDYYRYRSSYYPRYSSDVWDPVLRRYVPYTSAYDPYYVPSPVRPASAYLSTPSPARRRAMSVGRY